MLYGIYSFNLASFTFHTQKSLCYQTRKKSSLCPHQPRGMSVERQWPPCVLVSLLCFLSLVSFSESDEFQVLLKIKSALENPYTYVFDSWTKNYSICTSFTGIVCNFNGHVSEISLVGKNLTGVVPFDSICELQWLETLSLGSNFLNGSLTENLKNCTGLQVLDLSSNSLTGNVPAGIWGLPNLATLFLSTNHFTGELPAVISKASSLESIDLSWNNFSGEIPTTIGELKKLSSLYLHVNLFSGSIPSSIRSLSSLRDINLGSNALSGEIPASIGSLAKLNYLDLRSNNFSGQIPASIRSLTNLTSLDLSDNKLSGEIPTSIGSLANLTSLDLSYNKLSGEIPASIGSLAKLNYLDLWSNNLSGQIPASIRSLTNLTSLYLSDNQLSSEILSSIGSLANLTSLDLSDNKLSGEIPASIGSLANLTYLDLSSNNLSGQIPASIGSLTNLTFLDISDNKLSGEIPLSLWPLNSLDFSTNNLSGEIPSSFWSLRLDRFDLSNNMLTGRLPDFVTSDPYNSFAGNPGLCSQKITEFRRCSSKNRTVISCIIAGASVLLVSLACFIFIKLRRKHHDPPIQQDSWDLKPYHALAFTESEIINSIKPKNLTGRGSSGNVYKVVLNGGQELAVKHVWKTDSGYRRACRSSAAMLKVRKSRSPETDAEVATLSMVRHANVVKLYCSITSEDSDLLVYEYMCNGSLWDRLHTDRTVEMGWEVRYEIAVGSARGLKYLHHGCDRPVMHRDMKSSNILLDEELKPRIADFGLAKVGKARGGWDSTHLIAGTLGYIAPEYAYTNKVNEKSDVYSFGIVLMELVTGKKPIEPEFGENKDIVCWVRSKMCNEERILDVVDSTISEALKEDAVKVLGIAIHCTAREPRLRPFMTTVVQMLEEAKPRS